MGPPWESGSFYLVPPQVVELKPGGRDIPVTNSNRISYIHLVADYRLNRQVVWRHRQCHDTPWPRDSVKVEVKFPLECNFCFPCVHFMLRQMHRLELSFIRSRPSIEFLGDVLTFNPFTTRSDQSPISPAASPGILHHSMKNLAFHSLLRRKMITLPILTTSPIHFSLGRLGECTFWTWKWKG